MASVNRVILIGNLGRDPEIRKTPSGASVCSFSIATTEKFTDKQGQKQEETEWHNIVAWNKQADIMAQYLSKGSSVYIEGKLKTQSWDDNGQKKYKTDVVVSNFQFIGGTKQGGSQEQSQGQNGGGFGSPQQNGFNQPQQHQQQPQFQQPQQSEMPFNQQPPVFPNNTDHDETPF